MCYNPRRDPAKLGGDLGVCLELEIYLNSPYKEVKTWKTLQLAYKT